MSYNSGSNHALTENIRVEVLKYQMPSFKTYAEINCRMKVWDSQTLYVYASSPNRLTADRSLKLTIRGMPQENLNNIILFLPSTPSTSSLTVLRRYLIFIWRRCSFVFKFSWYLTHVEQTACGGESTTNTQYFTQESKGGLSDTQRPNARTEWNEPPKWTLTVYLY